MVLAVNRVDCFWSEFLWSELLLQLFCSTDQRARFGLQQLGIVLMKRFFNTFSSSAKLLTQCLIITLLQRSKILAYLCKVFCEKSILENKKYA